MPIQILKKVNTWGKTDSTCKQKDTATNGEARALARVPLFVFRRLLYTFLIVF